MICNVLFNSVLKNKNLCFFYQKLNFATEPNRLLPIEERESYKWISSSLNTKKVLNQAQEIIIIQDREGDIYEQFCTVPDSRTHLLIRAKSNRVIDKENKLFEHISGQPLQGIYSIELEGDRRRNIKKRTATIEVRFSQVVINRALLQSLVFDKKTQILVF